MRAAAVDYRDRVVIRPGVTGGTMASPSWSPGATARTVAGPSSPVSVLLDRLITARGPETAPLPLLHRLRGSWLGGSADAVPGTFNPPGTPAARFLTS